MKITTKKIAFTAVFLALTFVVTRFLQVPIPLGYFNVGNTVILLSCVILPFPYGLIIGSVGAGLADLTSYPIYTVPTLVIKTAMAAAFYGLNKAFGGKYWSKVAACAIANLIPLIGYTLVGGFLYGGFIAGLAQLPGLAIEYAANIVLFAALVQPVSKLKRLAD